MKLTDRGKMTRATRVILARLPFHNVEVHLPQYDGTSVRSVNILFKRNGGTGYHAISLTQMTPPEINLLREAVMIACELALPIAEAHLEKAKEDLSHGSPDTDDRVYRPLPIVVVNSDLIGEHDPSLLDRHPNVFAGSASHFVGLASTGGGGSVVAEGEPEESERLDDEAASGQS